MRMCTVRYREVAVSAAIGREPPNDTVLRRGGSFQHPSTRTGDPMATFTLSRSGPSFKAVANGRYMHGARLRID